jgi:dihydroorotate dehydrogenase (NAD+) catalytic subunit
MKIENSKPDLTINLAGIELKNPVMTASGTFGYGEEYESYLDLNCLGALVVKGLSLSPALGNPPPRIVETPAGMLNAIGLQNIGLESFIRDKLPRLRKLQTPVIVNFLGSTEEEYCRMAERLSKAEGVAGLEVNLSCPNIKQGGLAFGVDPKATYKLLKELKRATSLPLLAKLSPNVTDITVSAKAAEDGGADGLTLINTILGMAIDITTRRPKLANITGGLSGPAIKPIALRMVWQVAQTVKIPVIGVGGIMKGEDALEFIIAGASAIQVGTANFLDPTATIKVIEGIESYCRQYQVASIKELINSLMV